MTDTRLYWYAAVCIFVLNGSALLSPIINSGDALTYATIARHIADTGDWASLVIDGTDWLDKPHFPFWVTALAFKLGGVSAFTYAFPGFLFHLLGAYYTYRLARLWYSERTAALAVLLYASAYNLMDSAIEIKAEAYLRAEVLAACFYWWRYDQQARWRDLALGAFFTGLAVLTKGIFTLITISSGFICLWAYLGRLRTFVSFKWLLAVIASGLFVLPELFALYGQFGEHHAGQTVTFAESVRFFLLDSQFGRFFNTGPIRNGRGSPGFMVQALLIGFLPWSILLFSAISRQICAFKRVDSSERTAMVFLTAAFSCTFVLFMATRFQMSYYIDIVLPFAAILTARYGLDVPVGRGLRVTQGLLLALLMAVTLGCCAYVGTPIMLAVGSLIAAGLLSARYWTRHRPALERMILLSAAVAGTTYVFLAVLSASTFTRVGVASYFVHTFGKRPDLPVVVYQMPEVAHELGLYSEVPCVEVDDASALQQVGYRHLLVARETALAELTVSADRYERTAEQPLAVHKSGTFDRLLKFARGTGPLEKVVVMRSKSGEHARL